MALPRWTRLRTETLFVNRWWEYRRDDVALPDGRRWEYNYVHTPGSVMVLPRGDDGRFVLVRQYRYLNETDSIEFPAGGVRPGGDAIDCAQRELAEETGRAAATLKHLGRYNPFNGVTDEMCDVFLAAGLSKAVAEADDTEEFELLHFDADDIEAGIRNGSIWDGMTIAAWMLYRLSDS